MVKFVAKEPPFPPAEQPVHVWLKQENNKDVVLFADDQELFRFSSGYPDGHPCVYRIYNGDGLRRLGFDTDDQGKIKLSS